MKWYSSNIVLQNLLWVSLSVSLRNHSAVKDTNNHPASFTILLLVPKSLNIQHMVEVGDVTNCKSQDLNFGQLLVWWESWEQFSQLWEGPVEGHHADPLPGGVRTSIFGCGTPPPPLLLPAESGQMNWVRLAISLLRFSWHGPTLPIESVQKGLRVRFSPRQVGLRPVRTEHHDPDKISTSYPNIY